MITAMKQKGFTLIELMAVLIIVAILAAVAMPIYTRYTRSAAVSATQAEMLNIAGQLERWRAKNLSYAGFTPLIPFATTTGDLAVAAGETIYLPKGASSTNYTYQLTLLDRSVSPSVALSASTGQSWTLIAAPNPNHKALKIGPSLVLSSRSVRCMTSIAAPATSLQPKISNVTANSDIALCGNSTNPALPW